jgi:hypothetical protein
VLIRSPIAQFQCLFAQPWSPAFVSLGGPLRYTRLHEIADQERGMRQIASLAGPSQSLTSALKRGLQIDA